MNFIFELLKEFWWIGLFLLAEIIGVLAMKYKKNLAKKNALYYLLSTCEGVALSIVLVIALIFAYYFVQAINPY